MQIEVTIVDDNQWEPDEEFFLKLSLVSPEDSIDVKLGRTSIMEITILNDDGMSLNILEVFHEFILLPFETLVRQ